MQAEPLTPLIISGAPRSGTSLLYNLFDGHPEVSWLGDEGFLFEYVRDLGDGAELFLKALPEDVGALVDGLRDKQVMPPLDAPYVQSAERGSVSAVRIEWPWDESAFRRALSGPRPRTVDALWRWLAGACAAGLGQAPRRFGCMKSPDFGKSAEAMLRWCPQGRALIIVRDPLYSLDSLKRSRELRREKLLSWPLLALQVRRFQEMHHLIRTADPARLKVVRYETLVQDADRTMREIADWIGIGFDEALLRPTMHGQSWPGISSFKPTSGIQTTPVERPLAALSDAERHFAASALADLRHSFGYN
ncbi:MAG: sulfotransferase [Alphaproteobacteria bacterium]